MDIGRVAPGFHEGEETRIWRTPIEVILMPKAEPLSVKNVYVDDGILCIDVEDPNAAVNESD